MRRSIIKEFDQLAEALSSFTAMFAYRLKNLCVKAEEASLLSVRVLVEGELQNLEKCAIIAKNGDFEFMIVPKFEEDMLQIQQGIMAVHPEFKQEVESMKVETADTEGNISEQDARYIHVTMPEVDDDRYDVLKEGVKLAYDQCKFQMQGANMKADAKLAELTIGESDENMKLIKGERDKLNTQWDEHRDKLYNEKLQEIEEAHNKWLSEEAVREAQREEEEAAHNQSAAITMKLNQDED